MKKLCVVLTIPEPLKSKLVFELKELHKKYGSKCNSKHPNGGIYYDIPHITLLSMGACFENYAQIKEKLEEIIKRHSVIKIKSKELVLFEDKDYNHLVITIKKNKELQELHNDIAKELTLFSKKNEKFLFKLYNPHSSKILYLPKELGEQVKKDAIVKDFEFTAKEIGIKIRQEDHYCVIKDKFKLS